MSGEFRAPDPVRAHFKATFSEAPPAPAAPRIGADDHASGGAAATERAPFDPWGEDRPAGGASGRRKPLAIGLGVLAAPAVAAAALLGLGMSSGGGPGGGDLGSLRGATGVEGSAATGALIEPPAAETPRAEKAPKDNRFVARRATEDKAPAQPARPAEPEPVGPGGTGAPRDLGADEVATTPLTPTAPVTTPPTGGSTPEDEEGSGHGGSTHG